MEIYNIDKKPLRKKDTEAYYIDDTGTLSMVPNMFDSRDKIFAFILTCVKRSIPDITDKMVGEVWEEAEEKKAIILDALEQLKREHESAADYFKSAAYRRAIPQIQKLQVPILSGAQAQKIKGIGKGIASHIDEILKVGKLQSAEEREISKIERRKVIESLTKIWGVSSKNAEEWYSRGIKSMEDIPESELNDQQRAGIKYYEELSEPVSRDVVRSALSASSKALDDYKVILDAVGPYRRGANDVEIIDIIVSIETKTRIGKPLLRKIVAKLESGGFLTVAPVISSKKFMGIALTSEDDKHHRINVTLVPADERGTALLYFTGPQTFVTYMKEIASQQGYKLSEDGLYRLSAKSDEDDEKIPTYEEQDVFDSLGLSYVDPEDRF